MSALTVLTFVCAIGSGLIAGLFFIFSVCIMNALGKIPEPAGIAAMQSINVVIINGWFLTAFFGTAAASLLAAIAALARWEDPRAPYLLIGGALYLIGTIFVTMRFNVPRNNALAALVPTTLEAIQYWKYYLSSWTNWNHVRTIASVLALAAFVVGMRARV
jgi:uncharacterized membrane protein